MRHNDYHIAANSGHFLFNLKERLGRINVLLKHENVICINVDYQLHLIKSRRLTWAGHVARMGEGRSAFKILTGKPKGKRSLGRPRRRWEDTLEWILKRQI